MCGIAGIVSEALSPGELQEAVARMCRAQAHRGPDGEGVYVSPTGGSALGSRRLAVLDLSDAGRQPMSNDDGTLWITYNGEVYNFQDLKAELPDGGRHVRSSGDTEIVLRLYEALGARCLDRLRGMFAFAIWDERRGELFLARDRFGVKPVYYAWDGRTFLFASEIKALAASRRLTLTVDPAAVEAYLAFGSVPSPLTIYREIKALEPGHLLRLQAGRLTVQPYWQLSFAPGGIQDKKAVHEQTRALLAEAVKLRLVSDVPVGIFLSGGIDSSAIVALIRNAGHASIRTFSVAFHEPDYDEDAQARAVARQFGTEHTEYFVTAEEVLGELDRIIWSLDQPTIDGVNSYFVSKVAREGGVVVALSGLGGDEVFFGYSTFRSIPRFQRLARALAWMPGAAGMAEIGLNRWMPGHDEKLHLLLHDASVQAAYVALRGLFLGHEVGNLLRPEFHRSGVGQFDPLSYVRGLLSGQSRSSLDDVCRLELRGYMANQLLRDTDATSMAHSLEVRLPFLDHRLVEFVASVRATSKLGRDPKPLLLDSLDGLMPPEARKRPKQGFAFPLERWLSGPWQGAIEEALSPDSLNAAEFLNYQSVRELWTRFKAGRVHWSRVWSIAVLTRWLAEARSGEVVSR